MHPGVAVGTIAGGSDFEALVRDTIAVVIDRVADFRRARGIDGGKSRRERARGHA